MEPQEILALVGPMAAVRRAEAGTKIVAQGDLVAEISFMAEGEVELVLSGSPPVVLDRRGPGGAVGAEWAITGKPAGCDVLVTRPAQLLTLTREALLGLIESSRPFAEYFLRTSMEENLAVQNSAGRMYGRTNLLEALIARQADDRYGDLTGSSRLTQALRQQVREQSERTDPLLLTGEPGVGKELVAANIHLGGSRRTETFVVVRGDEWRPDLWAEKVEMAAGGTILLREIGDLPPEALGPVGALCVRAAADRPRLIATMTEVPGQKRPALGPWEGVEQLRIPALRERKGDIPELARTFLRELNAAYGATDEPINSEAMRLLIAYPFLTNNVAELRGVITHAAHLASGGPIKPEHLRLGHQGGRLGRPVVGIALGGGVVRGMAHIGVLQVLQAEAIPVDIVAGTSVGSLVGAAFAGGYDLAELERLAPTLSWPKLVGPVWPKDGMLTNVKLGAFVESLIGRKRIEELAIPYAAVAVDRGTGEEVILREGPVAAAVRASTAIPGLFAPLVADGRQLIDGGLVNNVPASVVRSMGADVVIGVDVRDYNYFNPGDAGGLMVSFLRGYDIMIHRAAQSELEWADVPIFATKAGANPYGFKMAKELIEAGREQARQALPGIRAAIARAESKVG